MQTYRGRHGPFKRDRPGRLKGGSRDDRALGRDLDQGRLPAARRKEVNAAADARRDHRSLRTGRAGVIVEVECQPRPQRSKGPLTLRRYFYARPAQCDASRGRKGPPKTARGLVDGQPGTELNQPARALIAAAISRCRWFARSS